MDMRVRGRATSYQGFFSPKALPAFLGLARIQLKLNVQILTIRLRRNTAHRLLASHDCCPWVIYIIDNFLFSLLVNLVKLLLRIASAFEYGPIKLLRNVPTWLRTDDCPCFSGSLVSSGCLAASLLLNDLRPVESGNLQSLSCLQPNWPADLHVTLLLWQTISNLQPPASVAHSALRHYGEFIFPPLAALWTTCQQVRKIQQRKKILRPVRLITKPNDVCSWLIASFTSLTLTRVFFPSTYAEGTWSR